MRALIIIVLLALTGCTSSPEMMGSQDSADVAAETVQRADSINLFLRHKQPISGNDLQHFLRVKSSLDNNDVADAVANCVALNKTHVMPSQWYVLCGDVYLRSSTESAQQAAASFYHLAIQRQPYNYHAHNRLAGVLRQQGRFGDALQHYDLALQAWPDFTPAYRNRAILFDLYIGDKVAALNDYHAYQTLLARRGDASHQVKGWIADLTRQIEDLSQVAKHAD